MPRLPIQQHTLRRIRAVTLALAVFCLGLIGFTVEREIGLQAASGGFLALGDACLKVGMSDQRHSPHPRLLRAYLMDSIHPDWVYAWRRFHVHIPGFGCTDMNYLAIPLWPILLTLTAACAWAQGSLRAIRLFGSPRCKSCG